MISILFTRTNVSFKSFVLINFVVANREVSNRSFVFSITFINSIIFNFSNSILDDLKTKFNYLNWTFVNKIANVTLITKFILNVRSIHSHSTRATRNIMRNSRDEKWTKKETKIVVNIIVERKKFSIKKFKTSKKKFILLLLTFQQKSWFINNFQNNVFNEREFQLKQRWLHDCNELKVQFCAKNIALESNISSYEDKRVWRIHIVHRSMQTSHISMIVERLRKSTKQHSKQIIIYKSCESCKLNSN